MNTGDIFFIAFLFCIGFIIYLAKYLATSGQYKWNIIFAKAVLNGMTSLFSGAILIYISVPNLAIVALAAILGTLGSEVIIKWIKSKINKK